MNREQIASLLAHATRDDLVPLADAILAAAPDQLRIVVPAAVGSVALQVREPVARTRFLAADAVASSAEVEWCGQPGWGMRLGDDRIAATAQAVCDAEHTRGGPRADDVSALCEQIAERRRAARAAEWERLQPTAVRFEEVL